MEDKMKKHESNKYLGKNKRLFRLGDENCDMCNEKLQFFIGEDDHAYYEINNIETNYYGGTDFTYGHKNITKTTKKKICIQCYDKLIGEN